MLLSRFTPKLATHLRNFDYLPIVSPVSTQVLWFHALSFSDTSYANLRPHLHSYFEAHFSVENRFIYHFPETNESLTIGEGQGLLISPNVSHFLEKSDDPSLRFSLSFLPDRELSFIDTLFAKPYLSFTLSETLLEAIDGVLSEIDKSDFFSPFLVRDHLSTVLCEIIRTQKTSFEREKTFDLEKGRVAFIKRFIKDNPMLFLTCRDIANQFHFNPQYLDRLFKKETGRTLLTCIHEEKVRQAQALLETTSLPIASIAHSLGFRNAYYFCTFFKRYTGIKPSEYRASTEKRERTDK